jgi:hypothetical protein
VNGTVITVPKYTLLQMPAFALTWQEVFTNAPEPWLSAGVSGLAKADRDANGNAPATTYEVHIQGNRVVSNGTEQYIAGLMFIAQQSLNAGAGFINYIDPTTGELRVGGKLGDPTTGARVVINDPKGKFAPVRLDDPRFTIDEDNPTVRSETGYPMCVAHGDDTCPESNRPIDATTGNFSTVFTMDATPDWAFMVPPGTPTNGTNPLMMAPFEVGDYVTYNGNLSTDANGQFVLAYSVIANVGIFTQPGTQPTYVAIDVMLLGVAGAPDPRLPQEATVRTRIEGFTTDPSSFIMLAAIDVDPCNGTESERWYDMVQVDPGPLAAAGRGLGAVAGRWRWRPNSDAAVLPPTRMLRATSINGAFFDFTTFSDTTPSGLKAGYYTAPNFTFIFPENLGIGNPPVPSNFQDFPFLANGSGAYFGANGGDAALGRLSQLSPWPGAVAPQAASCPSGTDGPARFIPIADAGPNQQAKRGDVITLDAGNSRDTTTPLPMPLTYTWWQVDNTTLKPLAINAPTRIALPAGTTPFGTAQDLSAMTFRLDKFVNGKNVDSVVPTTLTFRVDVTNCSPFSDPSTCGSSSATMTVTIVQNPAAVDTLTAVTATWRARRSRLDVAATTSDPTAVLTVLGFGDMGPALPIATGVPAPPGSMAYTQVGVNPPPAQITVRSSLGAIVTVPVTLR